MNDVTELLQETLELIETEEQWTQGTFLHVFRNRMGDVTAQKFCLIGAICHAAEVPNMIKSGECELVDKTFRHLAEYLDKKWLIEDNDEMKVFHSARYALMSFNDHKTTKHEHIEQLIVNAIENKESPDEKNCAH